MKYNEDMVLSMTHEEKRINEKIDEERHQIEKINSLYEFIEELVNLILVFVFYKSYSYSFIDVN